MVIRLTVQNTALYITLLQLAEHNYTQICILHMMHVYFFQMHIRPFSHNNKNNNNNNTIAFI